MSNFARNSRLKQQVIEHLAIHSTARRNTFQRTVWKILKTWPKSLNKIKHGRLFIPLFKIQRNTNNDLSFLKSEAPNQLELVITNLHEILKFQGMLHSNTQHNKLISKRITELVKSFKTYKNDMTKGWTLMEKSTQLVSEVTLLWAVRTQKENLKRRLIKHANTETIRTLYETSNLFMKLENPILMRSKIVSSHYLKESIMKIFMPSFVKNLICFQGLPKILLQLNGMRKMKMIQMNLLLMVRKTDDFLQGLLSIEEELRNYCQLQKHLS